jgi:hypothetical protein
MLETMRVRNRIYRLVDVDSIQTGDVVQWYDWKRSYNLRTNRVLTVTKTYVRIERHDGENAVKVHKKYIRGCWRWHKRIESTS